MRRFIAPALAVLALTQPALAHDNRTPDTPAEPTLPLLVIGASYGNGNTPFESDLNSPLLGLAVAGGNYLSLGDALVRDPRHNGFVINEAQASATTFPRSSCRQALYGSACSSAQFNGYPTQLMRAASRVRSLSTGEYGADYVIITAPNDCLHSDAFGAPEAETEYCDVEDMLDLANRMVEIGQMALNMGLTPVFGDYAPVASLDLELFRQRSLLAWTITPEDYQLLNDTVMTTLRAELPDAVFVNYWSDFTHIGDGIHPDSATSQRAARIILQELGIAGGSGEGKGKHKGKRGHH